MSTIWKVKLNQTQEQKIRLQGRSEDIEILDVQFQGNYLCLWAIVDLEAGQETEKRILILKTGDSVPEDITSLMTLWHIATVQRGTFVYHIFEVD